MKRGEIWWASLPQPAGSGPGYRRPVVIVQSDAFNRSCIQTVLCATITTNLDLAESPGNVGISSRESRLRKPSVVNVSQVVALDRRILTEKVKALPESVMRKIDEGLRLVLSL